MGFRQEALRRHSAPGQTLDGGLPSLPNRPRTPHVPHDARTVALAVALTLAGTAAAVSLEKASQALAETHTAPRTNIVPAELMRHGYEGKQMLSITQSADGNLNFGIATEPTVLQAGEEYWVPVLTQPAREENDAFDSINAIGIGEVMKGDVTLFKSDELGNPVVNADGTETLTEPAYVKDLVIPVEPELS